MDVLSREQNTSCHETFHKGNLFVLLVWLHERVLDALHECVYLFAISLLQLHFLANDEGLEYISGITDAP